MREVDTERMKRFGLNPEDFKPADERTTIEDLAQALDILASIVLGDDKND